MGGNESLDEMRERIIVMSRLFLLLIALVALAGCGVPEVDLDLPDRPRAPDAVTPSSLDPTNPVSDSMEVSPVDPANEPSSSVAPPDSDDLDQLEQLVSEIEALLEGVSEELDQITFEEEGG